MSLRNARMAISFGNLTLMIASASAVALPAGPVTFCETYPDAAQCQGTLVSCSQCHDGPPNLNGYGAMVMDGLYTTDPDFTLDRYVAALPDALRAVEADDSDGDGVSNIEEIMLGTLPGVETSVPRSTAVVGEIENPWFALGTYDAKFAFRRATLAFCGRSPSYDENVAFAAAADPMLAIHAVVDECLLGAYWRDDALHRMADKRIRPLRAVGREGEIVLADYEWDYRLFSYVMSGDRDVRDLLRAQYHVTADDQLVFTTIPKSSDTPNVIFKLGSGQPLQQQNRAGMITTQWFLMVNTMFTQLPRTTGAQAYRSYLGQDISKGEGIMPVAGEPRDVDGKGVTAPACAACHSTLDPLAYSFSGYNGIVIAIFGNPNGQFSNNRTPWDEQGTLLGQPVSSLVQWADHASDTDMFKRNVASMIWEHTFGHGPNPDDKEEFNAIWQALPEDAWSVNRLIHRVVDTDAFGAP